VKAPRVARNDEITARASRGSGADRIFEIAHGQFQSPIDNFSIDGRYLKHLQQGGDDLHGLLRIQLLANEVVDCGHRVG
jgi:hypothetical protein